MPASRRNKILRRRGAVKFDPTTLRELIRDQRVWCALGKVVAPNGDDSHFEILEDPKWGTDIMVHVQLIPDGVTVFARLGGAAGAGMGSGVWAIPAVDTEVAVLVPTGEISGDATIVAILASNTQPAGLTPTTIVIQAPADGTILAHDGDNNTQPLATKADIDSLASYISQHTHSGGTIFGNTGTPNFPVSGVPEAEGTSVLKAK